MQVKIGGIENQTIHTNIHTQEKAGENGRRKEAAGQRKNTIFAGDLPINQDPIALRRQQAQKKAMKFVQDAWNADRKMVQGQAKIREEQNRQWEDVLYNHELVQECRARKENLRKQYGVDPDSQEQEDLELLMRGAHPDPDNPLTEEEEARLEVLQNQPLTEYQEKCLEINNEQFIFESRQQSAKAYAGYLQSALTDMKGLKFHKMADAQKNAEKIMEQASEDIQGLLVEEAKDHVDETYEEQREEAKEKAEEKEEQEEKVEDIREEKELIEERIETIKEDSHEAEETRKEQERDARDEAELLKTMADAGMDVAGAGASVQAEIKDMLHKMKLIEADIKGIKVDEEV